jgi:hypothetical protein
MIFERTFPASLCITVVIIGGLAGLLLLFWVLPGTMRMSRRELASGWMDATFVAICIGFFGVVCLAGAAFAGSQLTDQPELTATVNHWRTVSYTPGGSVAAVVRQHCPATLAANELDAVINATSHREARRHPNPGRHVQHQLNQLDPYLIEVPVDCGE